MKKLLLAAVALTAAAGLASILPAAVGQPPQTGTVGPERFTIPVALPTQNALPPAYLPTMPASPKLAPPPANQGALDGLTQPLLTNLAQPKSNVEKTSFLSKYQSQDFDAPDINKDVAVQPSCGNFMICVISYSGNDAPQMARAMVAELRGPKYKLNAFVFTKGATERQAELKRIEEAKEYQRQQLAKIPDLPPDTKVSIPVMRSRFEIECLVLVGGYSDMQSAKQAMKALENLASPDPTKVKLNGAFEYKADKDGRFQERKEAINPFKYLQLVPNPSLPHNQAPGTSAEDMALMKRLNESEEYTLLKCPKKFTLAVKYFSVPVVIQASKSTPSVMEKQAKSLENAYTADCKAHVLAHMLRKEKLEAYVLHTKYCSYVTVGSYDRADDPRIARDQERLPQFINGMLAKISPQLVEQIKIVSCPPVFPVPN